VWCAGFFGNYFRRRKREWTSNLTLVVSGFPNIYPTMLLKCRSLMPMD
jgi:hypothetical protein